MKDPYLLHLFSAMPNASPFDINMAFEAEFDSVIPYTSVSLEHITGLTQDTVFSRGPEGVKRTAIFIGGRELMLAMDMLDAAKAAMVPPFQVSVMADPSGAVTTAAALVALVEQAAGKYFPDGLNGRKLYVFGGTGPVGVCAGLIAAQAGAEVFLVSHLGLNDARAVVDRHNHHFMSAMHPADGQGFDRICEIIDDAELILCTAKAGIRVLGANLVARAEARVFADVNAVPPSGIEGVGVHDRMEPIDPSKHGAVGIGALAIGDVKYKVHTRLLRRLCSGEEPIFVGYREAFECAREVLAD